MLRWYWYLCGATYAKQTALLRDHQAEDYERWRRTQAVPDASKSAISFGANGVIRRALHRHNLE